MKNAGCLTSDEFLVKVAEYFKLANEKKIAVRLTMKRLVEHDPVQGNLELDATSKPNFDISKKSQDLKIEDQVSQKEYPLLIRISYGSHANKNKCSTIVKAENLDKFWQDYTSEVKGGMYGLLKKKKKKTKNVALKNKKKGKK
ncbi:hypothetical protein NCAS_0B05840 [Naumovozyma castellii]|uniref:Signal recognition particle subunit SRP14 n=1 Tax=Naumovozyma castellii TaxID=27288 RepID=G0V9Q1_NAUCA|nr:hypothetical protein NCAS_0B05840 [Naumovozyma castellii CBS 4309]CCC68668.1 hypothetical protein NCAS_0B05840 [Naumovozyma castellii CBS 4309]